MANTNELKNYTDNELYYELECRGHYDVYEITVDDMKGTDIYEWAVKTGNVDSVMREWAYKLIDCLDAGDLLYDTLEDAAKSFGYELGCDED